MDKKKLAKFKEKLLESKTAILEELETEAENFIRNEQGDLVDIADVAINNELLNRLSDLDREKLDEIEKALEKIEDGTYGVCEGTGKAIPEARLNAIPWARYSVEYAEQVEKQKRANRAHQGFDD